MKNILLTSFLFFTACQKVDIKTVEVEKKLFVSTRTLTNSENNRIVTEKRAALGLFQYTESLPFFPNYSPKVGEVLYNNAGFNESLIIAVKENIATTFEAVRDSSRFFYRRMSITQFGDFAAFPCTKEGAKNDSADVYLYHKY